ncbi:hydroxyisourate hydrolase [Comamonadaceae bacterium OTU4NAUVB1]|jgi:5-hydroxyisourate hydrolase|nr:hydroxyisourate hydrolase [Comamonadaceae bacterium OTU4NAUVB1]HSU21836.1 hydroxyisourate hydrolase [Variovorax sp.]
MGLSTHVLDTMHGAPAAGMSVALFTTQGDAATLVRRFVLNADGRSDGPLYDNQTLRAGTYRLVFDVAAYFKARGVVLPEPNFLDRVSLDFGVARTDEHYHVPLLVSPWSYSTYRGS